MQIPNEIIERLKLFCEENNMGLSIVGNRDLDVHCIIVGDRSLGPNEVALLMASTILNGIVNDVFNPANEAALAARAEQENNKPN